MNGIELESHLSKSVNEEVLDNWTNDLNQDFYEKISASTLQSRSVLGGIEDGCDLDLIAPYLKQANTVLEIGAGYGRVLENILKRGFTGKLCAVERSENFCKVLEEKFANKAEIFKEDFALFNFPYKFDLMLWLWCGISDFTPFEQPLVIKHLCSYLNPNAFFIIDTFPHDIKPSKAIAYHKQAYVIEEANYNVYGYIPSTPEIEQYAKLAGFKDVQHLNYETPTGRKRILNILKNS